MMTDHATTQATGSIRVSGLSVGYKGLAHVVHGLDLDVASGEIVCIVGPSGVGKTTLLRCLAGLLPPIEGTVHIDGKLVSRPPDRLGLVFQDYRGSLMPWMTNLKNVAFPLQSQRVNKAERTRRSEDALSKVGLQGQENKYPWQLSGGMQQRVSLARALAYDADVLLMDEPFGSLDAQTRFELENLVLGLRRDLGITVLVVSHDIDEAVYLSDRVIVLAKQPSQVVDIVEIDLGRDREQLTTRADPRFARYRNRILEKIAENRRRA